MSNFWISMFATIGASTWVYTKLQKYSGNNTRQSITGTVFIGLLIFVVVFLILGMIF